MSDSGSALAGARDFTLPPDFLASVSLPPSLFGRINNDDVESVGVFFALYRESTLFPVRDMVGQERTVHPTVVSPIVASTVGPGFDFSNLLQPVEINLKTNFTRFEVISHMQVEHYSELKGGCC